MWTHLIAIIGLMALCALWVLFQLWLKKQDPEQEDRCISCGAKCKRQDDRNAPVSAEPGNGLD